MLVPETGAPATEGKVVIPRDELHQEENLVGPSPAAPSTAASWP